MSFEAFLFERLHWVCRNFVDEGGRRTCFPLVSRVAGQFLLVSYRKGGSLSRWVLEVPLAINTNRSLPTSNAKGINSSLRENNGFPKETCKSIGALILVLRSTSSSTPPLRTKEPDCGRSAVLTTWFRPPVYGRSIQEIRSFGIRRRTAGIP